MNKTKRVAWHKHLKKVKKDHDKARAQATQAGHTAHTGPRQTTPRR